MSGAQHTPGPWRAEPADMFGDHNIVRDGSDEVLAIAAVVSNLRPAEEVAANADLVSAAPQLLSTSRLGLAALERELSSLHILCRKGRTLEATYRHEIEDLERQVAEAKAAIAKATGGQA